MEKNNLINQAEKFAKRFHKGQKQVAGKPLPNLAEPGHRDWIINKSYPIEI